MRTFSKIIMSSMVFFLSVAVFADTVRSLRGNDSTLTIKKELRSYNGQQVQEQPEYSEANWLQGRNCRLYEIVHQKDDAVKVVPRNLSGKLNVTPNEILDNNSRFENSLVFEVATDFSPVYYDYHRTLRITCNPGFLKLDTPLSEIENDFKGAIEINK